MTLAWTQFSFFFPSFFQTIIRMRKRDLPPIAAFFNCFAEGILLYLKSSFQSSMYHVKPFKEQIYIPSFHLENPDKCVVYARPIAGLSTGPPASFLVQIMRESQVCQKDWFGPAPAPLSPASRLRGNTIIWKRRFDWRSEVSQDASFSCSDSRKKCLVMRSANRRFCEKSSTQAPDVHTLPTLIASRPPQYWFEWNEKRAQVQIWRENGKI